tara:strand:+ start:1178 stop:1477 length:300 start_codon:yes stop_codon:yes gene_type:complete
MRSTQIKQADEVRLFAHDAINLTPSGVAIGAIPSTSIRGACLYIGQGMDVTVKLESGASAVFKGLAAGSFLPVLAIELVNYTLTDTSGTKADNDVLALY